MLNPPTENVMNHLRQALQVACVENDADEITSQRLNALIKFNLVSMSEEELSEFARITSYYSQISAVQQLRLVKIRVRELNKSMAEWIQYIPAIYDAHYKEVRYKVLIIETDVVFRWKLFSAFTSAGFIADYAENYYQALYKIRRDVPDLIVMAIILPDASGFSSCQRIRKYFNIPVILMGRDDSDYTWGKVLDSGAEHYEKKPCQYLTLTARAKAILRRYKRVINNDQ